MLPHNRIVAVSFYVAGTDENRTDGYVNVEYKDAFKSGNVPAQNGIYDPHMGTTDNSWKCNSCFNKKDLCPGHCGVLELKYPVQNPMYKEELFKWLKIICLECGKLIIDKNLDIVGDELLKEHVKLTRSSKKKSICTRCNAVHPNIVRDKTEQLTIYKEYEMEGGKIRREVLTTKEMLQIFDRVSPETLARVGRPLSSHPRKFIISALCVPPNTIRPDIRKIGGTKSGVNDTTLLLRNIVSANEKIPDTITEYNETLRGLINLLELMCYEMLRGSTSSNNNKTRIQLSNTKPPASIASHIPKKTGRIRGSLMGKRTHSTCRSVISCDPSMELDELGVPIYIARKIQIPVTYREWNKDELNMYFENGDKIYPGCTRIKKPSGTYYVGKINRKTFKLEIGDIIYRDMIDGDPIAFNRAPSLLPSNMSCHKAKICMHGFTLRFNVSDCKLYNADFDGDEMNGYIPQSIMTRNEILTMMSIGERMGSYQTGQPTIGLYQDGLAGCALLTKHGQTFDKYTIMQFLSGVKLQTLEKLAFDKPSYTNYELVSMLLPNINYKGTPTSYKKALASQIKYNPEDIKVLIDSGVHKSGILDKAAVGMDKPNSIIHIIKNQYGSRKALDVVYNFQRVIMEYLCYRGFTLGLRDILISKSALEEVRKKTSSIIADSERVTARLNSGNIIPPIGMTTEEYYEQLQLSALSITDDFLPIVTSGIDTVNNGFYHLIMSGSRGNQSNLLMISSAIGQQTINSKRMLQSFGYNRSLPYFVSFDTNPEARGFIADSYISGLTMPSFIFASMEGRFSLISKSLTTAVTGAQNRTSIKNLESMIVDNLRRSAKANRIIQYLYGDSGMDPRYLEINYIPTVNISDEEFAKYKYGSKAIFVEEFEQMKIDRDLYRKIQMTIESASDISNRMYSNRIKAPLNMERIISDTLFRYKTLKGKLSPEDTIIKVRKLCDDIPYLAYNEIQRRRKMPIPEYWKKSWTFVFILLRSYMNVKHLSDMEISDAMIDIIIDAVKISISRSFMDYGTAVGILAAQSLSEPLSQYVLNSHHRSGGGGTKTSFLARDAEILGARPTEKMKNPSMVIQVPEELESDIAKVQEIANHIEMMSVSRFINSGVAIFYEKFGAPEHPQYKHESKLISIFVKNNPAIKPPSDLISWCIRFELNRRELILKNMPLESVIGAIQSKNRLAYVVYTPENADELVVRVYFRSEVIKRNADPYDIMVKLSQEIQDTIIRGVKNIQAAEVLQDPIPRTYIDADGSIKTKKIYVISTSGTNLVDMLAHPMVDKYKVQTDSILEIAEVYGIEAARAKIINELKLLIPSSIDDGSTHEHYTVYADEMTSTGMVTSIERTGMSKREIQNVMLKISTSFPIQNLTEAAIKGMTDRLDGISSLLMIGSIPAIGTTYNSFTIDEKFVSENLEDINKTLDSL